MAGFKNALSLHEAIVVALININKEDFSASFDEISKYIIKNNLFPNRKGGLSLSDQVRLRSIQSKGRYKYLFEQIDEQTIKLTLLPKSSIIKS